MAVLADETAHFQPKTSSFAAHSHTDLLSGQNSDGGVQSVDTSPRVGYKRRLSNSSPPMQKKFPLNSASVGPRALVVLLLCAGACLIVTRTLPAFLRSEAAATLSQRTLTFAERVAYQRAIEDVYWRHRIWPKERPDAKPSLDAGMSQAQLEQKVTDYLRASQALEDYWQRPIAAEQLQAEMDRMAKHTRQPDVLGELFEALGNDPFVIAEMLGATDAGGPVAHKIVQLQAARLSGWRMR